MIDLSTELAGLCQLYDSLAAQRRGVILQFIGVQAETGVSTCARAFARLMAPRLSRGAWLIDLDFYVNNQYRALCSPAAQAFYGAAGPALPSPASTAPFWRVHPALVRKDGAVAADHYYLNLHRIGAHNLYVSRFRNDLLHSGQSVHFRNARPWWTQMRDRADLIILDSPPLARGRGGLITAADADGSIIVARPAEAGAPVDDVRRQIEARCGQVFGVLFNDAPPMAQNTSQSMAGQG